MRRLESRKGRVRLAFRPFRNRKTAKGESETEEFPDRLLVRGRELVVVELVWPHPAMVVDTNVLDGTAHVLAAVDAEIDVVALVRVLDVNHAGADRHGDAHLLVELALQSLRIALACFYAPAGELPEQRQRGVGRALGDEVFPVMLDHRPDHADLPAHDVSAGLPPRTRELPLIASLHPS